MYMVEVFKTDVTTNDEAKKLIDLIHFSFNHYQANFDLDDCDCILRIKCESEPIETNLILSIFNQYGFNAEVLMDDFELEI